MTSIKQKIISLNLSNKIPSVNIVNDTQSPVLGNGIVQTTPSLTLTVLLYVPKFSVGLLSISQFTKHNNNKITFFPSYVFQDLSTGGIGLGHETEGMYYLDDRMTPTGFIAGQPDPVLLWHWSLVHSSVQKLQSVVPIKSSVSTLGYKSCELGKHRCVAH